MKCAFVAIMCLLVLSQASWSESVAVSTKQSPDLQSQIETIQKQLDELHKEYSEKISELERKIEQLGSRSQNDEDTDIRRAAEEAVGPIEEEEHLEDSSEETVFKSGALGLQALNPEISVVGDMVNWYGDVEGEKRHSDFGLRVLGVHFESYLDPYSKLKACVPVTESGTELGEAYLTRYDVGENLNLTLGKFHQQFGIVNRWHAPSLDQVEFPLALRRIFGGPLVSTGASFEWLVPKFSAGTQMLTVQLTNGSNERLFGQNSTNFPSLLAHYKNYRDISKDLYSECGVTALAGRNDEWQISPPAAPAFTDTSRLWTAAFGVDYTLLWEPTDAMRYKNWIWRTEGYYLKKRLLAPNGSGPDTIDAWGAYSYFQSKVSRTTEIGVRADYYKPDVKSYADASLSPLAVTTQGAHQWQLSPYITWWQSPWVKWRLEYDHLWGKGLPGDDKVFIQCTFAAGPHKHERY